MLRFKLGGIQIGISIWFAAFFAVTLFVADNMFILYGIFSMICHELGHFVMMWAVGVPPRGFYLLMGRLVIEPSRNMTLSFGEVPVLLGGIAANLLCACIFGAFGNRAACIINLFIAAYNALPAGQLDGGAVLLHVLSKKLTPKRAYTIHLVVTFLVSFLLLVAGGLMLLNGYQNASTIFSGSYLMAQNIKNMRYTN